MGKENIVEEPQNVSYALRYAVVSTKEKRHTMHTLLEQP